jgi:endonuclease/exonuclease/phosphatase family metal-dependent hydrolase
VIVCSHVLIGCEAAPHTLRRLDPQPIPPLPLLKIITFNVDYEVAPTASAEVFDNIDADVICLQESTPAWEEYLRQRLKQKYPHIIFHHEPYAGGLAILSRYPMTELLYEKPPAGWLHGLGVKIETDLGAVKLLSVHLRPAAAGNGGHWNYFLLPRVHPKEMDYLYTHLQFAGQPAPTIVLGDFNESDDGNAMQYLRKQGLIDSLGQFDRDTKTWHGEYALVKLSERCDHILYSPELKCLDAAVVKKGASDHFPVVAVMEMSASRR